MAPEAESVFAAPHAPPLYVPNPADGTLYQFRNDEPVRLLPVTIRTLAQKGHGRLADGAEMVAGQASRTVVLDPRNGDVLLDVHLRRGPFAGSSTPTWPPPPAGTPSGTASSWTA